MQSKTWGKSGIQEGKGKQWAHPELVTHPRGKRSGFPGVLGQREELTKSRVLDIPDGNVCLPPKGWDVQEFRGRAED